MEPGNTTTSDEVDEAPARFSKDESGAIRSLATILRINGGGLKIRTDNRRGFPLKTLEAFTTPPPELRRSRGKDDLLLSDGKWYPVNLDHVSIELLLSLVDLGFSFFLASQEHAVKNSKAEGRTSSFR